MIVTFDQALDLLARGVAEAAQRQLGSLRPLRREDVRTILWYSMSSLTPRELQVVCLRWGLADGHTRLLAETGRLINNTRLPAETIGRERVRQIEMRAFRKLCHRLRAHLEMYDMGNDTQVS